MKDVMLAYDLFNGDADGLCALVQLRLAEPRDAELVTGAKRDIALVERLPVGPALNLTVLDVSLDKNRRAVDEQLVQGSRIDYVDHHYPGESLPDSPAFSALIDTDPLTCTSLLVDRRLAGRYRPWALVGAYGDNLSKLANPLAREAGLDEKQIETLCLLGTCLNYNGYGASTDDLLIHPAELFSHLVKYADPFAFIEGEPALWNRLKDGYQGDMDLALAVEPLRLEANMIAVLLPDELWARRVSGVLGNALANRHPERACAVLTEVDAEHYLVSVRAPLSNRTGADALVRRFPTGGGRKAAAGIDRLPRTQLDEFLNAMAKHWQ